jgi:hypothetical protein
MPGDEQPVPLGAQPYQQRPHQRTASQVERLPHQVLRHPLSRGLLLCFRRPVQIRYRPPAPDVGEYHLRRRSAPGGENRPPRLVPLDDCVQALPQHVRVHRADHRHRSALIVSRHLRRQLALHPQLLLFTRQRCHSRFAEFADLIHFRPPV